MLSEILFSQKIPKGLKILLTYRTLDFSPDALSFCYAWCLLLSEVSQAKGPYNRSKKFFFLFYLDLLKHNGKPAHICLLVKCLLNLEFLIYHSRFHLLFTKISDLHIATYKTQLHHTFSAKVFKKVYLNTTCKYLVSDLQRWR